MNIKKGTKGWFRSHTDEDLKTSALRFKTINEWKRGPESASYQAAAYQRRHGREDFWRSITAHMVRALNPWNGAYFIYACLFHATKRAYVGLSCRAETVRLNEHRSGGPVFEYAQGTGADLTWGVVERGIPDPQAARDAERRWHDHYATKGWFMLNSARTGSLGTVALRIDKAAIKQRALDFSTRKAFTLGDRSAYNIAKRMGWYEEITAHMEDSAKVRSRVRTGEKRSDAAKAKMRAAKVGTKLTEQHRRRIGDGLRRSGRYQLQVP